MPLLIYCDTPCQSNNPNKALPNPHQKEFRVRWIAAAARRKAAARHVVGLREALVAGVLPLCDGLPFTTTHY